MFLSIFSLLFTSFLLSNFLSRNLTKKFCVKLTLFSFLFSFIFALTFLWEILKYNSVCYLDGPLWFACNISRIFWSIKFDFLSCSLVNVILFITIIIYIYSLDYMKGDPFFIKFMSYLILFCFFMLGLVSFNNLVGLFLCWEGVGLCSFLLISYWNTRVIANKSALKAFILNRIGDVGLLFGIVYIHHTFGSLDFDIIFNLIFHMQNYEINFILNNLNLINLTVFFLFIGAIGKSAQLFLHSWLPDAMEGPTPVSALLHSATMVTAGVYLLNRFSFFVELSTNMYLIISFFGAITSLMSGFLACFQYDIKKIIAYSTCSQLGYMFVACGLSLYDCSIFHLINHAFFKALLFLSAGSVIHGLNGEQDIRKMGGLAKFLPVTYSCFLIASLSLMGFPFLSGYFSKDLIIELCLTNFYFLNYFCYFCLQLGILMTSLYSFRLLFYVFYGKINSYKFIYKNIHEMNNKSLVVMSILCVFSIFSGFLLKKLMLKEGSSIWGSSIYISFENRMLDWLDIEEFFVLFDKQFIFYKIFRLLLLFLGIIVSYYIIYKFNKFFLDLNLYILYKKYTKVFYDQFFFDKIYSNIFIKLLYKKYTFFLYCFDKILSSYKIYFYFLNTFNESVRNKFLFLIFGQASILFIFYFLSNFYNVV